MKKNKLIKKIAKQTGLKKKKSENILNSIVNIITKELGNKKEISINGFGDFKIVRDEMRIILSKSNIKTVIPPKETLNFIPRNIF